MASPPSQYDCAMIQSDVFADGRRLFLGSFGAAAGEMASRGTISLQVPRISSLLPTAVVTIHEPLHPHFFQRAVARFASAPVTRQQRVAVVNPLHP
eukprot:scaffold143_cov260-Pinguiococcus_pyrenoidosus.AAC.27